MFDKKIRINLLRAFLPIFFVFCVMIPRSAFAFQPAPIGIYGVPGITDVVQPILSSIPPAWTDLAAAGAIVAVGAAMSYMTISYLVNGTQYDTRIPLTAANPVPAPSAPSSATPIAPGGNYNYWIYGAEVPGGVSPATCLQYGAPTAQAACTNVGGTNFQSSNNACMKQQTVNGVLTNVWVDSSPGGCTAVVPPTCPAGYTVSGSTCTLSDARAATPDNACDFARTGSALAAISDPDCAASGTLVPTICATDGTTCVGWGTAPNGGAPRSYVITPNGPGGSTVTTYQQSQVGGSTVVTQTTVTVNPDGTVASVGGSQQTGSIPNPNPSSGSPASANPAGTPGTVTPTAGAAVTPTGGSTSGGTTITFPTDYARQGEAQKAADSINTQLQKTETDLLAPSSAPVDATPVQTSDFTNVHFLGTFTNLLAWTPNLAGVCPTHDFSVPYFGSTWTFSLNSHCQLLEDNRAVMSALMVAAFTVAALFVVLGA